MSFDFESWLHLLQAFNFRFRIELIWVETKWTKTCWYICKEIHEITNASSRSCIFCCFTNYTVYIKRFTFFSLNALGFDALGFINLSKVLVLEWNRRFHSFLANSVDRYWLPILVVYFLLKTYSQPKVRNWSYLNLSFIKPLRQNNPPYLWSMVKTSAFWFSFLRNFNWFFEPITVHDWNNTVFQKPMCVKRVLLDIL